MVEIRTGDIETRASVEEPGEYVGELPIIVTGGRQSEVLKTLTTLTETIETFEEPPSDWSGGTDAGPTDDDGTGGDGEGNENSLASSDESADQSDDLGEAGRPKHTRSSPHPDEEIETYKVDGIWHVKYPEEEHPRRVETTTRSYQILWHVAHYQHTVGEAATNSDIAEHYDHLEYGNVSPSMTKLRRCGLVQTAKGHGRQAKYELTAEGESYLREHGKPMKYAYPDDSRVPGNDGDGEE